MRSFDYLICRKCSKSTIKKTSDVTVLKNIFIVYLNHIRLLNSLHPGIVYLYPLKTFSDVQKNNSRLKCVYPFVPNVPFRFTLQTLENLRSSVFGGRSKGNTQALKFHHFTVPFRSKQVEGNYFENGFRKKEVR